MTGRRATVLIVDDNSAIAETYASFLEDDYEVLTAYGGREALETVDPTVDVVLLDRRMPEAGGDEVLAEIDTRALDCRVVVLTAVDPEFDIVDMPVDAYVTKPVKRSKVRDIVAEMVRRAGYDDELRQFLALASKKVALEREKDGGALAASEEYERIERRLAEKRERLGIETDEIEGTFADTVPDIEADRLSE